MYLYYNISLSFHPEKKGTCSCIIIYIQAAQKLLGDFPELEHVAASAEGDVNLPEQVRVCSWANAYKARELSKEALCMCACACVRVCVCACVRIHTHTNVCIYIYVCMYVYIYIYIYRRG